MVAPTLRATTLVELVGQSGMTAADALPDTSWADDWRVLMARSEGALVLLAGPLQADMERAAAAAERGLAVWRLPPVARNFAEAHELAKRQTRSAPLLRVASWWEHVDDEAWSHLEWPDALRPIFSELRVSTPGPDRRGYQPRFGEPELGVLAADAYGLIETLVATRGLPERISAFASGAGAASTAPAPALSATAATLQYNDGGAALLRAAWNLPPAELLLAHYGSALSSSLSEDEVTTGWRSGELVDRRPIGAGWLASDLRRFIEQVGGDAHDRASATLERHLAATALCDAVLLSAQTQHPESPLKFYELAGRPLQRK